MLLKDQQGWLKTLQKMNYPTPFKVMDLSRARARVLELKHFLPSVEIYYAIKSCNDGKLIEAIDDVVSGYDIASLGELEQLESMGIGTERMLYSNPVKIPSHIKGSAEKGVNYYAFDSVDEIKKLSEYAPGSNVYLRVKVSDYGSKFPLSKKFGVPALHAVALMATAKEHGLNPCGLAFHVGSQSENPHTWAAAFEVCGETIKKLEHAGIHITMLNIGGGFPTHYTDRIASMRQIAKTINTSIQAHIPDHVRIVAEPGRYICADSSVIVTSIIARENRGGNEWLFLDMGVFQGLMECLEMENWRYPIFTDHGRRATNYSQEYVLTGPTCDAYDTIGFDYSLPSTMKMDDRLYIGVSGAYTSVYESNFNGFSPPKTYYIGA